MNRRLLAYGLVLTMILSLAAFLGRGMGSRESARFPSSYAAEPEGLLAFRRLVDELGLPNSIWAASLVKSDRLPERGVLLVATPLQRPFREEELPGLRGWLHRGGSLLVIDDATTIEPNGAIEDLLSEIGLEREPPAAEPDLRTLRAARPATARAHGTAAVPSSLRFRQLVLHRDSHFTGGSQGIPLAIAEDGDVVAAESRVGEGRVIRVLGALLARDLVLEGDNLDFALGLIEDLRGDAGSVMFDEYHHGFGSRSASSVSLAPRTIGFLLIQSLVLLLLFAAARGYRFGPPRPARESQRRSSLEFVHSMASLYRRAGFRGDMLVQMVRSFHQKVGERFFRADGLDAATIAHGLSVRSRVDAKKIRDTLESVARAAEDPRLTDRGMLVQARKLDRIAREVFGDR